MLLRTIALDYDGTIATNGVLHPKVRVAIRKARSSGLLIVIVTGRILRELRQVAGDLSFVDAVVAENGAVIQLANGHKRVLGRPPFPVLLNKLRDRGIEFVVGRCLVDLDAKHAHVVLSILQELQLPLSITFNRSRMMVLPQSISKSSGLRDLLKILGESIHNTIGIGDAENDYELLKGCEYGVAVDWAPSFLKDEADFVLPGEGPDAVAEYINRVSSDIRLPAGITRHSKLILESIEGKSTFEVAIRGRNILIVGDTKSGKSWLAGLLCEQMILQDYTILAFDPEGDYSSLDSLPNTVVIRGGSVQSMSDNLMMILQQGLSIVLDLSHLNHNETVSFIRQHLPMVAKYRRNKGYPHRILLDECHYFLDSSYKEILDPELGSFLFVTYRPSQLPKGLLQSLEAVIATRLEEKSEVDIISQLAGPGLFQDDLHKLLGDLETTEAALLPPTVEAHGVPYRFTIAPRLTLHVRHCTKYFDGQTGLEEAFVFTENGISVGESATTLSDLAVSIKHVTDKVIDGHLQRHDFSSWITTVIGDLDFANAVRKLESQHHADQTVSMFGEQLSAEIEERYKH